MTKLRKNWKGIKNNAKNKYIFATPGNKEFLKNKMTTKPIKKQMILNKKEKTILFARTSLGEYFFFPT